MRKIIMAGLHLGLHKAAPQVPAALPAVRHKSRVRKHPHPRLPVPPAAAIWTWSHLITKSNMELNMYGYLTDVVC